ncbi:eukaryotic translation initiation factor [Haematococcus lacustris]
MAASRVRQRWGDTLDEEEGAMPENSVTQNGNIKTVTEYSKNDKGEIIKKTTKTKIVSVEKKVYAVALERRKWERFGQAAKESASDSVTMQANEDIPFERVRQQKTTQQEKKQAIDFAAAMQSSDKAVVSTSIKDLLYKRRMERELLRAKGLLSAAEKPPDENEPPSRPVLAAPGQGKANAYVPPSLRNRGPGERMEDSGRGGPDKRRDDQNSVRVTNLSEDVTEADLQELFRPFGHVTRCFVAVDRETGENRGFAFVNYAMREDAERAIRALNGFGYDNLILRVEFAQPRAER